MVSKFADMLIDLLLKKGVKEIEPKLDYDYGVSYYESLGISRDDFPNLNDILIELERKGILKGTKVGTIPTCPNCGSHKLILRLLCPICDSQNIRRVEAIHHISCNFTAPSDMFSSGEILKCPNCGKPLRAIGVDYNKYQNVIYCENCKRVSISPKLIFICSDCGESMSESELDLKPLLRYEVIEERLLKPSLERAISEGLERRGVEVKHPSEVIGASGLTQRFSLSVKGGDSERFIDIVESSEGVGEEKVLALFGKLFDISARGGVLVAIPRATQEAKTLAKSLNIEIVEASNLDEALMKLHSLIKEEKRKDHREVVG